MDPAIVRSRPAGPGIADGPDFRGKDLSRRHLGGMDLTNAQMQDSILYGTDFSGVVSMDGANLTGAKIGHGTDFTECDLSNVTFGPGASFGDSPYYITRLVGTTVPFSVLGRTWRFLDLTDATIVGLSGDLTDLTVSRTILGATVDFSKCTLTNARFSGVALRGVRFHQAKLDKATFCSDGELVCDLVGADFSGASLNGATFQNCTVADFGGASLNGATFQNCTVADFTGVSLNKANFQNCNLTGADFAGAGLNGANLQNCNLTGADFTGTVLTGATITSKALNGCRFDNLDLTNTTLGYLPPVSARDKSNPISFRGAKIKLLPCLVMSDMTFDWSCLDLSGATIVGLNAAFTAGGNLKRLKARYALLGGFDFSNAALDGADMTGAALTGVNFANANLSNSVMCGVQSRREVFRVAAQSSEYGDFLQALRTMNASKVSEVFERHGCHTGRPYLSNSAGGWTVAIPPADVKDVARAIYEVKDPKDTGAPLVVIDVTPTVFTGATLTKANFAPDQSQQVGTDDLGRPTVLRGARFNAATMNNVDLSYADLAPVNPVKPFDTTMDTRTRFDDAVMNDASLVHADLSRATLARTSLHSAHLNRALMKGVDLTGAQLGAQSESFHVPGPKQGPDDYRAFLAALMAKDVGKVAPFFQGQGIALTPATTLIDNPVPERCWTIRDSKLPDPYTVLNWTPQDQTASLVVSRPTRAAILDGACLAYAKVINTNLYGVSATQLQMNDAEIAGAILDGCKITSVNLSGSSLKSAWLCNLDLSNANLIDTKFNGADLREAILANANVQGADFTDAQLNGANFGNAAVALPLNDELAGTYLFTVAGKDAAPVLADLQAAAALGMPVTLASDPAAITRAVDALKKPDITAVQSLFASKGITVPGSATIRQVASDDGQEAWKVTGGCDYTVWHGGDSRGRDAILTGPGMPNLAAAFPVKSRPSAVGVLRWQATVATIAGPDRTWWRIFNDNRNWSNHQLGYDTMLVVPAADGSLDFYGTSVRFQQLGDDKQEELVPLPLAATILGRTRDLPYGQFGPATTCPNNLTVDRNKAKGASWEQLLRAVDLPDLQSFASDEN